MAEFVLKDMVKKHGLEKEFEIKSAATSTEEIGNGVHPGTRKKLAEYNISTHGKHATQLQKNDYEVYDYLIGMDAANIRNMHRILDGDQRGKIALLLDFTDSSGDIADPWYTGDFDMTYRDVKRGCEGLLHYIGI
jgi:protein-tyrosine phosphatase